MSATLVPAVARMLGCRNSIAAVVVEAIRRKARKGWSQQDIVTWLGKCLGPDYPATDPKVVRFVLDRL